MSEVSSKTDRVFQHLRLDLLAGLYPPNSYMEFPVLRDRYAATEMPMRLALNRAVGERLLEERDGHGLYTPRAPNTIELEEVFLSNRDILITSPRRFRNRRPLVPYAPTFPEGTSVVAKTEALFLGVAGLAGEHIMYRTMERNHYILHWLRAHDHSVLDNLRGEIDALIDTWTSGDPLAWEDAVLRYTDRRLNALSELTWLVQATR